MPKTVVAVFRDYNEAEAVLHELETSGFRREDMSLVAADRVGGVSGTAVADEEADDAAARAGTGAAVGGVAGLVAGLAALAIPGIGPIVAAGPLAAALTGAGVGAMAGGMIGALTQIGIPDEEATSYAEAIRSGGTVVAVRTDDDLAARAEAIFDRHDAVDIEARTRSQEPQSNWKAGDPHNQAATFGEEGSQSEWGHHELTARDRNLGTDRSDARTSEPGQSTRDSAADDELRSVYQNSWASKMTWEEWQDAYHLGHTMANSSRYRGSEWADVETDARQQWETHRPGLWERFQEVIRFGWDHDRRRQ